ncbi:hypothetical protein [Mangrovactinospora gilvigrisea]|uniref:hypothetical protein n=1 Tax=Mangrovactinospora gilvigrisea TaxID=1428644 RepID=UPI000A92A60A|nr:hypothetical protein [Mangrovactinospora gilvigrisea]
MKDTLTIILICIGLMFAGGVYSFAKQQMPKQVVVLVGVASALFLALGVYRWVQVG